MTKQGWLVRMLYGRRRYQTYRIRDFKGPKCMTFKGGIAAIGETLTQTLEMAVQLHREMSEGESQ